IWCLLWASSGWQDAVSLHHPVDALDVDRRPALLLGVSSDRRVQPAIAVGRLIGDHLLDIGEPLSLGLRAPPRRRGAAVLACATRFDRATPSASAIVFTASRSASARAHAIAFGPDLVCSTSRLRSNGARVTAHSISS